jgi:hypothetical protein
MLDSENPVQRMNLAEIRNLGISKALNERDSFDTTLELREID